MFGGGGWGGKHERIVKLQQSVSQSVSKTVSKSVSQSIRERESQVSSTHPQRIVFIRILELCVS